MTEMTEDDKGMYDANVEARQELGALVAEWLCAVQDGDAADVAHSAAYDAQAAAHKHEQELHKRVFEAMPYGHAMVYGRLVLAKNPKGCVDRFKII